jgi:capsular polysaccharide biosynthesis protein
MSNAAAINPAWFPPEGNEAITKRLAAINARKINLRPKVPDILTRLKGGRIYCFYRGRLKKYLLIRKLVNAMWRNFYPKYVQIITTFDSSTACRWRSIVKMTDYVNASNIPSIKIFNTERVDTPPPIVIPDEDQAYLSSPHTYYEFPLIYVAQLSDAQVYGRTNLVFVRDAVICHDLYDFIHDYTSEEFHGRHVIDGKKKRIRLARYDANPEYVSTAATFLDSCSSNYAHWLTEVLPRVAIFCSIEQYANVPIIVDDDLHPNIMESLALVVGNDREIIALPVGRAINVGILYITSVTGYVPFERRNKRLARYSHGLFSPLAFDQLHKRLLQFCDKPARKEWPKKIYLRRNSIGRNVTNDIEVEQLLVDNGYVIIEPERLTFLQQFALFSSVEEVVGPSGAALANLIFLCSSARLHILIGRYRDTSFWYWQNMACASGKIIHYILGDVADGNSGIHADFSINRQSINYISECY